ncbi:XRE family transcriptional regulator [Enterococcus sp. SMC-9]|nr:XRE family transcriptional regulator [Enterococcus sp. SMC-9]
MIGAKMKALRLEHRLTLEELADTLNKKYPNTVNFNKGKLSKWENGKEEPKLSSIRILADFYSIKIDDFYSENTSSSSIEAIYNQLVPPRQEKVYNFASEQLEEQKQENILDFPEKGRIPTIQNSASAANPTELTYGDTVVEEEEFERIPSNADFAVPIIGDSMEPVIRNGQFVFVKEQPDVEDGEIAIVEIDGDGVTCKEVYRDYKSQTIILRSINGLYEDRVVSPEQIRIIGKVVF